MGELQPDETVDAVREARVLSKLDHPSIVKFHDSFIDGESFCIVTEFCEVIILNQKVFLERPYVYNSCHVLFLKLFKIELALLNLY